MSQVIVHVDGKKEVGGGREWGRVFRVRLVREGGIRVRRRELGGKKCGSCNLRFSENNRNLVRPSDLGCAGAGKY